MNKIEGKPIIGVIINFLRMFWVFLFIFNGLNLSLILMMINVGLPINFYYYLKIFTSLAWRDKNYWNEENRN